MYLYPIEFLQRKTKNHCDFGAALFVPIPFNINRLRVFNDSMESSKVRSNLLARHKYLAGAQSHHPSPNGLLRLALCAEEIGLLSPTLTSFQDHHSSL